MQQYLYNQLIHLLCHPVWKIQVFFCRSYRFRLFICFFLCSLQNLMNWNCLRIQMFKYEDGFYYLMKRSFLSEL